MCCFFSLIVSSAPPVMGPWPSPPRGVLPNIVQRSRPSPGTTSQSLCILPPFLATRPAWRTACAYLTSLAQVSALAIVQWQLIASLSMYHGSFKNLLVDHIKAGNTQYSIVVRHDMPLWPKWFVNANYNLMDQGLHNIAGLCSAVLTSVRLCRV